MKEKIDSGEIRYNDDMTRIRRRTYLADMKSLPPSTLWTDLDATGHNRQAKYEQKILFHEKGVELFSTPKPERLIRRILDCATKQGDIVLDSFLGSGTTAAVAHKMGRHWIGIETGDHARTHCAPRLKAVIDGEQGGVSKALEWEGGGGYQFYKLGTPVFDDMGQICEGIKYEHLAAHVWFSETHTGRPSRAMKSPHLGVHEGTGYYLLYNGILGDKRPNCGNVLTLKVLDELPAHDGPKVIFGEATTLSKERLKSLSITFYQTPYDIKGR